MSRQERWGTRDQSYSAWHRTLADDVTYIDIDGCEYCNHCGRPLALIELAQDVGQSFKPTPVIRKLASLATIPAYLVFYQKLSEREIGHVRWRLISPQWGEWASGSCNEWASVLESIHGACPHPGHMCTRCIQAPL